MALGASFCKLILQTTVLKGKAIGWNLSQTISKIEASIQGNTWFISWHSNHVCFTTSQKYFSIWMFLKTRLSLLKQKWCALYTLPTNVTIIEKPQTGRMGYTSLRELSMSCLIPRAWSLSGSWVCFYFSVTGHILQYLCPLFISGLIRVKLIFQQSWM